MHSPEDWWILVVFEETLYILLLHLQHYLGLKDAAPLLLPGEVAGGRRGDLVLNFVVLQRWGVSFDRLGVGACSPNQTVWWPAPPGGPQVRTKDDSLHKSGRGRAALLVFCTSPCNR